MELKKIWISKFQHKKLDQNFGGGAQAGVPKSLLSHMWSLDQEQGYHQGGC